MVQREVTLPVTLHARPAAAVVAAAAKCGTRVQLAAGAKVVDAKSLLSILSLGAAAGTTLTVQADGDGAAEAVDMMANLLESLS